MSTASGHRDRQAPVGAACGEVKNDLRLCRSSGAGPGRSTEPIDMSRLPALHPAVHTLSYCHEVRFNTYEPQAARGLSRQPQT